MLNKWVVCKCEGDLSQHLIVVNFLEIVYHFSEVKRFQSVTSCLTNPSKIWSYVYDPCSPLIVLLVDQPRLLQEVFLNIRSEKQDNKMINLKSWSFLTKTQSICFWSLTLSRCHSLGSSPGWICQSDWSCCCGPSSRFQMPEGEDEKTWWD